jgi:ribosomal protein S12 methylthiotransferase accessory factor
MELAQKPAWPRPADELTGAAQAEVGLAPPSSAEASVWSSDGLPKIGRDGSSRSVPASDTVRRVAPLMRRIGVTRVAEVTHLDRNGVPNFIAARPREAGTGISYYNGKGASRSQARASAMMEAIERFSAEAYGGRSIVQPFEALAREAAAVDPLDLIVPRLVEVRPDLPLEWVEGFDLIGRRPTWTPLNAVVCPYRPRHPDAAWLFLASSNGLASGNTREEALCQALCEVMERDAFSLHDAATRLKWQVESVLAGPGESAESPSVDPRYPLIDGRTLPPRARRVHDRLTAAGLSVRLRDLSGSTGIAAFRCAVQEPRGGGRVASHGGFGCHPDAQVAALRALTEAAQSRVGFIQGGREDLPQIVRRRGPKSDPQRTSDPEPVADFATVPSARHATVGEDVTWILSRMKAAGLGQAVAFDLTRPALGVPVVRVVVPRAEVWSVYRMHCGHGVVGPRALRMLD